MVVGHPELQSLKPVMVPPDGVVCIAAVQVNDVPIVVAINDEPPADAAEFLNVKLGSVPAFNTTEVVAPLQIVCGEAFPVGNGFTNTVAVTGVPEQVPDVGVMVKVTVTGAFVVLVNVPLISPVPLAAIPVTVPLARSPLSLVQLYVVPATGLPFNTIVVIAKPLQTVCEDGVAVAVGVPETVSVTSPGFGESYCMFQLSPAGNAG